MVKTPKEQQQKQREERQGNEMNNVRRSRRRYRPTTLLIMHLLSRIWQLIENAAVNMSIVIVRIIVIRRRRRQIRSVDLILNNPISRMMIIFRMSRFINVHRRTNLLDTMADNNNNNYEDNNRNFNYNYVQHWSNGNVCTILYNAIHRRHRHLRILRPIGHLVIIIITVIYRPFVIITIIERPFNMDMNIIIIYNSLTRLAHMTVFMLPGLLRRLRLRPADIPRYLNNEM